MSELSIRHTRPFPVRLYLQMCIFHRSAINMVMAPASTWVEDVQYRPAYGRVPPGWPHIHQFAIVGRCLTVSPLPSFLPAPCRFNEAFGQTAQNRQEWSKPCRLQPCPTLYGLATARPDTPCLRYCLWPFCQLLPKYQEVPTVLTRVQSARCRWYTRSLCGLLSRNRQ